MRDIKEMAREVKMPYDFVTGEPLYLEKLEAFAELVRADEREKYKWDVHSCGPTCTKVACMAMREAVKAEREACAKVCKQQSLLQLDERVMRGIDACTDAIRARGQA